MKYKITNREFANYTGQIGTTRWLKGESEHSIDDPMDVDMVRLVFGVQPTEGQSTPDVPVTPPAGVIDPAQVIALKSAENTTLQELEDLGYKIFAQSYTHTRNEYIQAIRKLAAERNSSEEELNAAIEIITAEINAVINSPQAILDHHNWTMVQEIINGIPTLTLECHEHIALEIPSNTDDVRINVSLLGREMYDTLLGSTDWDVAEVRHHYDDGTINGTGFTVNDYQEMLGTDAKAQITFEFARGANNTSRVTLCAYDSSVGDYPGELKHKYEFAIRIVAPNLQVTRAA